MGKCQYLIDISPYAPLCDHPCRLYGGGAVVADCESCEYDTPEIAEKYARLCKLAADLAHDYFMRGYHVMPGDTVRRTCKQYEDELKALGIEGYE